MYEGFAREEREPSGSLFCYPLRNSARTMAVNEDTAAAIFSKTVPSGFAGVHKFRIAHNTVALSIPNARIFPKKYTFCGLFQFFSEIEH